MISAGKGGGKLPLATRKREKEISSKLESLSSFEIKACNFYVFFICQGCRRFETSVFFSVKINILTTGGFRVGFFQPDTNHPLY